MVSLKKNSFIFSLIAAAWLLVGCDKAGLNLNNPVNSTVVPKEANMAIKGAEKTAEYYEKFSKALEDMSLSDERAMGEAIGLQAYATPGFGYPIKNDEVMLYMNVMANVIAQNSNRPLIPYHVAVVKSDEFNAFAIPGGYIFITSALVLAVENEAELAGVLGHEIAHISCKHALNDMKKGKFFGVLMDAFTEAGGAASKEAGVSGYLQNHIAEFSDMAKEMSTNLLSHSFSVDVESDSDKEGIRYAYDTGYDPRAMLGVLEKLKAKDKDAGKSHPTAEERVNRIKKVLDGEEAYADGFKFDAKSFNSLVTKTTRLDRIKELIRNAKESDWK